MSYSQGVFDNYWHHGATLIRGFFYCLHRAHQCLYIKSEDRRVPQIKAKKAHLPITGGLKDGSQTPPLVR